MPSLAGLQGVGEAGAEAILPLNRLPAMIADAMKINKEVDGGNTFIIKEMIVREEADIDKVARGLFNLQNRKKRGGCN